MAHFGSYFINEFNYDSHCANEEDIDTKPDKPDKPNAKRELLSRVPSVHDTIGFLSSWFLKSGIFILLILNLVFVCLKQIANGRPMTTVSIDVDDPLPLSPSQLLTLKASRSSVPQVERKQILEKLEEKIFDFDSLLSN